MCTSQHSPIDMLMYYDTRPSVFNGVFDFYTYEKLKGYYAFNWYGMLYDCEKEIPSENRIENVYSLCGVDKNGKVCLLKKDKQHSHIPYIWDKTNNSNHVLKLNKT